MQGSKLVIHWNNRFTSGMAYVMLGRSQCLEDIYIQGNFDTTRIHCSQEALEESRRLEEVAKECTTPSFFQPSNGSVTIGFINIQSYMAHLEDLLQDPYLMSCDILGLGETWLNPGEEMEIKGFKTYFGNGGRGKGIAAAHKKEIVSSVQIIVQTNFSLIFLSFEPVMIIFAYLSQGASYAEVVKEFKNHLTPSSQAIILGDMNFEWQTENNYFTDFMRASGYQQLVNEPTHDCGRVIDHIYISPSLNVNNLKMEKRSVYFSDHDAIFVKFDNWKYL